MLVPRPHQLGIGLEELGGVLVFVHRCRLAAGGPPGQRRMILDGEPVERQVIGLQGERAVEIGPPVAAEGAGQTEDEIERYLGDAGVLERCRRRADLLRGMGPVHPGEHGRIERLRPE
ncbi:MAG TPA: hypothetical protein VG500_11265 [Gemmatimonadales bacterium]|nr:hypothetical protein [Gemmatimonadales bacterium]